jgi:hypothetical protein
MLQHHKIISAMNTNLQSARSIALNYLAKFAKSDNFWQDFESAFGRNYDKKIALDIKSNLASNTLTPPEIVIVDRTCFSSGKK